MNVANEAFPVYNELLVRKKQSPIFAFNSKLLLIDQKIFKFTLITRILHIFFSFLSYNPKPVQRTGENFSSDLFIILCENDS